MTFEAPFSEDLIHRCLGWLCGRSKGQEDWRRWGEGGVWTSCWIIWEIDCFLLLHSVSQCHFLLVPHPSQVPLWGVKANQGLTCTVCKLSHYGSREQKNEEYNSNVLECPSPENNGGAGFQGPKESELWFRATVYWVDQVILLWVGFIWKQGKWSGSGDLTFLVL